MVLLLSSPLKLMGYGEISRQDSLSPLMLKGKSLESLMEIDITTVGKTAQPWAGVPAAVYVITSEDIRRSGKRSLPEILRLAPNLEVSKVNGSQWAISARGFNNVLANKLLVLIDGRSVYTPLYAGVFWDVQDELPDNIDRIEVISGPGGTLWGANAVNGIINIITKKPAETAGILFEGGAGAHNLGFGSLRYGGKAGSKVTYRVYGKARRESNTLLLNGDAANDGWQSTQAGFRTDIALDDNDDLSIHSDLYHAEPNPDATTPTRLNGGNLVARWEHTTSPTSGYSVQGYYDRTSRDFGSGFLEIVETYDFDVQERLQLNTVHELTLGGGLRSMNDREDNLPLFGFFPPNVTLALYSGFVVDEMTLITDRLKFDLGTKYEHNDYTGGEWQPGARLAWTPNATHTLWSAVTRAVRTPSRTDRDFKISISPAIVLLQGGSGFASENVIAYEVGWRMQANESFWITASTFYNVYDNIRSAEPGPAPLGVPITIGNGVKGSTTGFELSAHYLVTSTWRLQPGYSFLTKSLEVKSDSKDLNKATAESDDPKNRFQLHSSVDLPHDMEFDCMLWYVDLLPSPQVPRYFGLDMRLGWSLPGRLQVALVGQNLLETHHPEFVPASPSPRELERTVYGVITVTM